MSCSSLGNAVFAEGEGGDLCCIKSECFIVKESSSRKKQQHFDVSGAGLTQDQSDSLPAVCFRLTDLHVMTSYTPSTKSLSN